MGTYDMKGKVAVVTGGAQGLGREIVEQFAECGASVVFADLNGETGRRTEQELGGSGADVLFVQGDISNEEDVERLVETAVGAYGRIDYLVNNASLLTREPRPLVDVDPQFVAASMRVNVVGTFTCMKHVIAQMVSQGTGGAVVNVSSTTAVIATQGLCAYGASKSAINNLTEVAAAENACYGIRVNAVMPGSMLTEAMALFKKNNPERFAEVEANIPLKRMADPAEVAQAVIWLCSDGASYVTGTELLVDGGQYVQNVN